MSSKKSPSNDPVREQLLQAGDVVGHCRVIELIAAGGMANVYKVWHEQLEVIRAIKILKPGFSDESRGRLEMEAKISANLRHTNIVEIYGMGYWNEIPYLEMEYIDGPSLKELLEKNIRLPVPFSLSVVHFVCTALQFAYNQDMTLYGKVYDRLIHRDIKPANILLNSKGIVKLADFGIARPSEVSIHTVGSKVMGTFAYLSPEQLNGEKLDQRSDVYSLGTVLYEMLTGSKTFPQKLLAELVQKKSRGQFIPVSSMGIRLSHQLCSAVEKSLTLDRSKRFCDAGEFDEELYQSLRKLTVKSPEEITRTYLKNPYSPGSNRRSLINFRPIFRVTVLTLTVILVAYLSMQIFPIAKNVVLKLKHLLTSDITLPQNENTPVSQPTVPPPSEDTQTKEEQLKKEAPPPHKKAATVDPLTQALKQFNLGAYNEAIAIMETIATDQLTSQQKTVYTIRLLQSYVSTNRMEDAAALINKGQINDGLFYLIKSTIAVRNNQLNVALQAAKTARTTPSEYDASISEKASFQIATIHQSRYLLKPNRDNLQNTRNSWETYIANYCSDQNLSPKCSKAQKQLAKLN